MSTQFDHDVSQITVQENLPEAASGSLTDFSDGVHEQQLLCEVNALLLLHRLRHMRARYCLCKLAGGLRGAVLLSGHHCPLQLLQPGHACMLHEEEAPVTGVCRAGYRGNLTHAWQAALACAW